MLLDCLRMFSKVFPFVRRHLSSHPTETDMKNTLHECEINFVSNVTRFNLKVLPTISIKLKLKKNYK